MAQGGGSKFPPEIIVRDNDPSKGSYTIKLTIPHMKVKSVRKGLKKVNFIENGEVNIKFEEKEFSANIKVEKDGKTESYNYSKPVPEDISSSLSKYELKAEKVLLILKKNENKSWGQYEDHFTSRT